MKDPNIKNEESLYPNFGTSSTQTEDNQNEPFFVNKLNLKLNLRLVIKPLNQKDISFLVQ